MTNFHPSLLHGLGTALVTPFKQDKTIDFVSLGALIEQQIDAGADYLVVLGTTSEAATMNEPERLAVRDYIIRRVAGRVPLVLGVGGNCTRQVVEEIQQVALVLKQHFAAILSVCPYYNKPTQEGMYQHFTTIAEASPVPVILYNVPGRTGVNLLPETVERIREAQPGKVVGIKEASGNVEQIRRLLSLVPTDFLVISGDDQLACELMEAGAKGLISVASNAFPAEFRQIVHRKDRALSERFAEMVRLLFAEGNPVGIKGVLAEKGLIHNVLRLPLVACSPTLQAQIRSELSRLSNQRNNKEAV